jgi:hypothetical protein
LHNQIKKPYYEPPKKEEPEETPSDENILGIEDDPNRPPKEIVVERNPLEESAQ